MKSKYQYMKEVFKIYWKIESLGFLVGSLTLIAGAISPYILKLIIDELTSKKFGLVKNHIVTYGLLLAVNIIFLYLENIVYKIAGMKAENDIRKKMIEKLMRSDYKVVKSRYKTGDIISLFVTDADNYGAMLSEGIPLIFANFGSFISSLIAMFIVDYRYALLVLPILPVYFIFDELFWKKRS